MLRVGHGVRNILNKEQCGGLRVTGSPLKRSPIPRRESEAEEEDRLWRAVKQGWPEVTTPDLILAY